MDDHQDSPTVAEYADRWLETHCAPPYRAEYIRRSRISTLGLYVFPTIGHLPLTSVTTAALADLQRKLFAKGLKQSTVRTALGHFMELWKSARADGLVTGRPHTDLVWPRERRVKPTVFTSQERNRIIAAAVERQFWWMPQVALMFLAGMRPSEAAGMRFDDLDPRTGCADIAEPIVNHERTQGKTRKSLRSIILDRRLVLLLLEHQRVCGRTHGLMSQNRNRSPVHTGVFVTYWRPLLADLGIAYRPPYAMRHTYITLMLMDGAPAAGVAEYCGTSIQEIERSYLSWIGAVQNPMSHRRSRVMTLPHPEPTETREVRPESDNASAPQAPLGAISLSGLQGLRGAR